MDGCQAATARYTVYYHGFPLTGCPETPAVLQADGLRASERAAVQQGRGVDPCRGKTQCLGHARGGKAKQVEQHKPQTNQMDKYI